MKKILIPFLLLVVLINACKKDETTIPAAAKPSESPMAKILENKTWTEVVRPAVSWELGYSFSASLKGKITQLGCRMPEPGIYTVSVWNETTKALLRQKAVEQTSPDKFTLVKIDELTVEKDTKYIVTLNTVVGAKARSYYRITNTNATIFPITIGSIIIQKALYGSFTTPTFPNSTPELGQMYGYPDFTFTPD